MTLVSKRTRAVALVLMAAAAAACGTGGGSSNSVSSPSIPVVASVAVALSPSTVQVGQSATATAVATDQSGAAVNAGAVTWASSNPAVATVNSSGVVMGVGPGTASITATASGKTGQAIITVAAAAPAPVATIIIAPASANLVTGATQQLTATLRDASGATLAGAVSWSSSNPGVASVDANGLVTAVSAGTATITATSQGKSGTATITVVAPSAACSAASALHLAAGEVRQLTPSQMTSLCVGGLTSASEYVLIPFNNSNVASSGMSIQLTSTNTVAVTATPDISFHHQMSSRGAGLATAIDNAEVGLPADIAFHARERRDIGNLQARAHFSGVPSRGLRADRTRSNQLTGVPATPAVGSIVQLNANLLGNTCTDPKQLHPARVVALTTHAIVLVDTLAPAGGYTDAELTAFATAFDTVGFALDTLNFGSPTDIDTNGRVAIFFTTGVNVIPGPPDGFIGGLFAARDLFPATTAGCTASNEGEMFYMPVPDPNGTINSSYTSKSALSKLVLATLVHEFQHLINAGRRIYVNNAPSLEEVWLNEGLSHIAEELLYYRVSGNSPRTNIALSKVTSSQAQVDAFNTYAIQNFGRLQSYLAAPMSFSAFSLVDGLEMRGAIWSLLRYSADQKGGVERNTWYSLVNSTLSGQANFNAVFGDIISNARNWAVSLFMDDIGFSEPPQFTDPSWNFRTIYPALTAPSRYPVATSGLVSGTPVSMLVVGGGAGYIRFRINSGFAATVVASSSGQPLPANIDFFIARTQ